MSAEIDDFLNRYLAVVSGNSYDMPIHNGGRYKTYIFSNFRGGIGKTTLSFNMAYKFARDYRSLFVDVCPQTNFSELFLGNEITSASKTIYDALLSRIMGAAWANAVKDKDLILSRRVRDSNSQFDLPKMSYVIPGSNQLFLFPSTLYTQLNQYYSMGGNQKTKAVANLLTSLDDLVDHETFDLKTEKIIVDTSPFFGGATHLAWMMKNSALIIPVRVDEQSLQALKLTLDMLENESSDFNMWRERAGIEYKPKVQAIAMTHCGWNTASSYHLDSNSLTYVERAVEIANDYKSCFSTEDPINHFAILQDFHGAGKISGTNRIPIDNLISGKNYTVDRRRLKAYPSVERYKKELEYLYRLID